MRKYSLLAALYLLILFNAVAQQSPGREFIIVTANDTIYGEVNINSSNRKIGTIEFASSGAGTIEKFSRDELNGFYDKTWGLYRADFITEKKEFSGPIEKKVLFEVLVDGKFDLLLYRDDKPKFYIKSGDKPPEELILMKYEKVIQDKKFKVKDEQYKRLLKSYMADCSSINVDEVDLKESELKQLFVKYNKCNTTALQYVSVKDPGKFNFGVLAGGYFSSIKKGSVESDFGVQAGVFVEYFISKRNQRVFISGDLNIKTLESDNTQELPYGSKVTTEHMLADLTYLRGNLFFNYSLTKSIFLSAGVSNSFVISGELSNYKIYPTYVLEQAPDDLKKWEVGFIFGAGIRAGKFTLHARGEFSNGFDEIDVNSSRPLSKVSSAYLLLSYRFKK